MGSGKHVFAERQEYDGLKNESNYWAITNNPRKGKIIGIRKVYHQKAMGRDRISQIKARKL